MNMTPQNDSHPLYSIYDNGQYKQNNSNWHTEDSPWKARQVEKILSRNSIQPQTIAEVGCGAGEILRQLSLKERYQETRFVGYEISADAFELCKQRESENVQYIFKDIVREHVHFDVLLCLDVFEHVPNYMQFLDQLRQKADCKVFHIPLDLSVSSLLRGRLLYARRTVGHLHYFTPDTALATLRDCGYTVIDTMYTKGFADFPAYLFWEKVAKLPRHILYSISPKLMSTLIGGSSLMVLAQ